MVGVDSNGNEKLLCEMKFYAGLTANQPGKYLDRLKQNKGIGCVFICPRARQTSLWSKLLELCCEKHISPVNSHCVRVDGILMSIITWPEILEKLTTVAASSSVEYLADIHQLKGYCLQMDSEAFVPFNEDDLSPEIARKAERYYKVIDETIDLLCADDSIKTSKKGTKASAYRDGYCRSLRIGNVIISLVYDRKMWMNSGSVETPFWMAVRDENWQQPDHCKQCIKGVHARMKDDTQWGMTWLALEALPHSTLDEVCQNLKKQILVYLELCR